MFFRCIVIGFYLLIGNAFSQNTVEINCFYDDFVPNLKSEDSDSISLIITEPFKKARYLAKYDNKYYIIFNVTIDEPCPAALCIGNDCFNIFLDSSAIFVKINKEDINGSNVTNSTLSDKWNSVLNSLQSYKSELLDHYADQWADGGKVDSEKLINMHRDMDTKYLAWVKKIIDEHANIIGWTVFIENIENVDTEYINKMLVRFKQFQALPSYERAKSMFNNRNR